MEQLQPARERSIWLAPSTVAAVVIGLGLVKLYLAVHTGLAYDEGYYTFWSQRLAVGYLDHPPAVAWMIALGRTLVGDNEVGVRLLAIACGLGTSAALYRVGVLLLGRRIAALAVLWYNFTPVAALGFITTPDPPSMLFWMLTLWAIAEFMASGRAWWWLVAGVMAGLGLWSKYTDAFLAPGILLLLLSSRERRRWFGLWQLWAGGTLALIVFSPVIWWNAQRNWISFRFQGQRTVTDGIDPNFLGNLGDLLAGQALYMIPILATFALVGVGLYLVRPNDSGRRGLALPVLTAVPALAYFLFHILHAIAEANWLIPLWPPLTLVAAWCVLGLWASRRLLAQILIVAQIVLGVLVAGVIYAQALYQPFDIQPIDRTDETRGWPGVADHIARLAHDTGAHWIAMNSGYAMTGEVASYMMFAHDRLPVRQIDRPQRWSFLPPLDPDALGWPALYVRVEPNPGAPKPPDALFGQSKLVGQFQREGGRHQLESWSAFVVSQPTAAFWAGLK